MSTMLRRHTCMSTVQGVSDLYECSFIPDITIAYSLDYRTMFGREFELTTHTALDSHRFEEDVNHWQLVMNEPGDCARPIEPPAQS